MPFISISSYKPLPSAATSGRQILAATPCREALATTTSSPPSHPSEHVSLFRSAISSFSRRPNSNSSRCSPSSPLHHSAAPATARRLIHLLFRPSTVSYNVLINSLLLDNQTEAATSAFGSLLSSGLPLTTSSFTIFLKLMLSSPRTDRFDTAYSLLDEMLCYGHPPDAVTYSTLIAALSRAGRLTEALGVFDLMFHRGCIPTPQSCTSLIYGYCSLGKIKEARHFLCLIETYGIAPDTFMYTVLIDALSRIGDFNEVEMILGESQAKGWKPDEITYNVYMNGLCKAGRIGEAFGLLDAMSCDGLFPSLETLNILFDCLCREFKLQEAVGLLGRSSEFNWSPDIVFYNTLMSRCLDGGCSMNVLQFLSGMVKRGIEPDACTLTLIIRHMYRAGKLQSARCMINADWSFVPDVIAFNTLLHLFYLVGENKEVLNLFADMIQKNVTPNKFTYCLVIDCLYKEERTEEAIDLAIGTVRDQFMQDLVSRLLRWFSRGQRLGEILKLFQRLGRDFVMDVASVNSLIIACCKAGLCQSQDFYRFSIVIDKILGII